MNSNMPPREPPDDDRDTFKFVVLATGRSQKGCGMAFIKKPFRRLHEGGASEADTYIDLAELNFENEGGSLGEPAEHLVKVAEVYRYEDIADLTTHVYNGNILLVDYTSLASDDLAQRKSSWTFPSPAPLNRSSNTPSDRNDTSCEIPPPEGSTFAITYVVMPIPRRKWKKWNRSFRASSRWAIDARTSIVSITSRSIFSRWFRRTRKSFRTRSQSRISSTPSRSIRSFAMSTRKSSSFPRPRCRIVRRIESRLSSTVT